MMEYTTTYLGIEKIEYRFSIDDIRDALMEKFKIKETYYSDFRLEEDDDGFAIGILTIKYTTKKEHE